MLIYHGHGTRRYDLHPVGVMSRRPFEFQAVVRGSIAIVTPEGAGLLRSRQLWLSAPGHPHGWTGAPGESAEVVVFHYRFIPAVLERLVRAAGLITISLTPPQCRRLKALSAQALRYSDPPSAGTPICHEQIIMELSLMVLESRHEIALPPDEPAHRVEAAMRWYAARMEENPSLEQIASAVGSSPATLRRSFQTVMQASPKAIFDQLRFQRAMQMLLERRMKIEAISQTCGFGSASAFSRAFKHKTGISPEMWRSGGSPDAS